jgi:hypothetical protein
MMGETATTPKNQRRFPYGAADAHHEENLSLLRRLSGINGKARDLLVWVANIEHRTGEPLRRTYEELGESERGLRCSRATAARIVAQLRELGVLTVTPLKTSAGQRPNAYSIDWDGVHTALFGGGQVGAEPEPESHFVKARVSKCASQSLILQKPESQNDTHNKEHSLIPLLRTLPNRTGGERLGSARGDFCSEFALDHADWPQVCQEAKRLIGILGDHSDPERKAEDRELLFKVVWLAHLGELPEAVTAGALGVIKSGWLRGKRIENPWAAYRGVLVKRCQLQQPRPIDFHALLARVPVPPWAEAIVRPP